VFRVVFSPESRTELEELKSYIAARESHRVAAKYLNRLKAFCRELAIAPHRGERRQGIKFNQRTIGFERLISIIFEVLEAEKIVNISGIRYAGRSLNQND
jgi:toxin ParE1/3/4